MTFGLVARCDPGGLSTITAEVFRHLCPAKTLLLDGHRGMCNESLYESDEQRQRVVWMPFDGGIPDNYAEWIGSDVDVLFSAEYWYDVKIQRAARDAGVRTVMLAMPELAPWATTAHENDRRLWLRNDVTCVPTAWRIDTLPGAELLPVPVARDRLPPSRRARVEHLYHVTGAAMLDRNGTNLLLGALPLMREECRVTVRTERPITVPPCRADVTVLDKREANYWDAYPEQIDLLVMPRRYGGLCLPVQECASLGVPSVVLAPDPYAGEAFTFAAPASRSSPGHMKGAGQSSSQPVQVYDADPAAFAAMLDRLIAEPEHVSVASAEANAWAERHAWDGPLGHRWCETLAAECETIAA